MIQKIAIDAGLHQQVKIAAATNGETMRVFTERALAVALAVDNHPRQLVDPMPDYAFEEVPGAD